MGCQFGMVSPLQGTSLRFYPDINMIPDLVFFENLLLIRIDLFFFYLELLLSSVELSSPLALFQLTFLVLK